MSTHLKAIKAVTLGCIGFNPLAITHDETNPSPTPLKPHRNRSRVGGRPILYNGTNPSPTLLKVGRRPKIAHDKTNPTGPQPRPCRRLVYRNPTQDPSESFWYPEGRKAFAS